MTDTTVHAVNVKVTVNAAGAKAGAQAASGDIASIAKSAESTAVSASASIGKVGAAAAALPASVKGAGQEIESLGKTSQGAGKQATEALGKVTASAGQTRAAMRMLPAQMTDIGVGLSTGQSPFMVMLQQGGQLKDMFGGIAPAMQAVGTYALGMVGPFGVATASVGALALAYYQGSQEGDRYVSAMVMTGNAAGTTAGQLEIMARNIDATIGTQAQAAETLAAMAATGKVAGEELERYSATAVRIQRTVGTSVQDTVKVFEELGKNPVRASEKLNESMNYLTLSVYDQIRALQEQGKEAEAASLAQRAYADAMDQRTARLEGNLGSIQRSWRAVGDVAREAWDEILGVGRPDGPGAGATPWKAIGALSSMLPMAAPALLAGGLGRSARGAAGDLLTSDAEREATAETQRLTKRGVEAKAALDRQSAIDNRAQIDARKRIDDQRKATRTQAEIRKSEHEQLERDAKVLGKNLSAEEKAKLAAGIDAKYKDAKGPKAPDTAREDARARVQLDVEGYKAQAAKVIDVNGNTERVLEAQRAAGLVDERDYYAQKKTLLDESTQARIAALNAENERLAKEKLNTKDSLDRERQVLSNRTQIEKLQADAASRGLVLDLQQAAAMNARAAALLTAKQAAQEYFETMERQQKRDVAGIGKGQRQRSLDAGLSQIEDRYSGQRGDLDNSRALLELEGKFTEEARSQYEARLALIESYKSRALSSYEAYFGALSQKQEDWRNGANEATADYLDSARDVAGQTKELFSNGFKGMEDAVVSFVTTGKADFKSLANSIIADIVRMQVKAAMSSVMGGSGGSSGSSGILGTLLGGALSAFGVSGGVSVGINPGASGATGGFFKNAKGGVYTSPSLSAYSGGIYDTPQTFAFAKGAGIFAEAGPEAILPLQRDAQGRLGVAAQGGSAGGQSVHYAPVTHVQIDARSDRASVAATVNRALAENNRGQMAELQRAKVLPQ